MGETRRTSGTRKQFRLTGGTMKRQTEHGSGSWSEAVEQIIQHSISKLIDQRETGKIELESTIMLRCLHAVSCESHKAGKAVQELSLFSKPIGLYSFQLRDRRYCCIESVPPVAQSTGSTEENVDELREVARKQALRISSVTTVLQAVPTTNELLSVLLDHLQECHVPGKQAPLPQESDNEAWRECEVSRVHSARRSAIRNWEKRLIQFVHRQYRHGEDEMGLYHYPHVDLVVPDGNTLLALMVAPLDTNFVDEKVSVNDRVPDITLGVFDIVGQYYSGSVGSLVPLLKQGFGRLLFTNMHHETDMALSESNEARSAVLRHWVKLASSGIHGLLERERIRTPFDAFEFCEAVVRRVLCAAVEGVDNMEVFPFDRAYIFYEAGTSTQVSDRPMRVRVVEASMLSNAPADRGQHLTSRERRIRGTDDFECNPSRKRIDPEDIVDFHIHAGDKQTLILTRQERLDEDYKAEILRETRRSVAADEAESYGYKFAVPDLEDVEDDDLTSAVYNLMGRLISDNRTNKPIEDPLGEKKITVQTFAEAFERLRLKVTDRADKNGLYFLYKHGVTIDSKQTPLLSSLQGAYQAYLDDHFRAQDTQFLRERYRRENMPRDQVEDILDRHRQAQRARLQKGLSGEQVEAEAGAQQRSKVVYVSFSWQLHDENMRQLRLQNLQQSVDSSGLGRESTDAMLGPEFTYTLVLVADKDPEKSLARLRAEREDLKLFFQIMMERIWADRRNEFQHLEKKSRSVGASIQQFAHRAKELIQDPKRKEEVDEFIKNIRFLTQTQRTPVETFTIRRSDEVFARLPAGANGAGEDADRRLNRTELKDYLVGRAADWTEGKKKLSGKVSIQVLPSRFPELSVQWSDAVVRDAFNVAVKNGVEAAAAAGDTGRVTFQIQASPGDVSAGLTQWYMDLVVENTGGPIDARTLRELNQPDPVSRGKNTDKPGSTGVGVFLARYQLMEVIGLGADMIITNTGRDVVQTRIRLPARLVADDGAFGRTITREATPASDYILYVEDSRQYYERTQRELERLAGLHGLTVEHRRGRAAAVALAHERMPVALITDLTILENENDSVSQRKYGDMLLREFLRLANDVPRPPPIWVLSQETREDILEALGALRPYSPQPVATSSPDEQTSPRSLCVFSGIKTHEDLPAGLIEHLVRRVAADPARDLKSKDEHATTLHGPASIITPVTHKGFDANVRKGLDRAGGDHEALLLFQARATRQNQVVPWLETWFQHPGLPDRDPVIAADDTLHRLTDHMYHKRVLMEIAVGASVHDRLAATVLYWGVQNNVWFSAAQHPPDHLVETWVDMHQETKGPLSSLRHDIRSLWVEEATESLLRDTVEAINLCEKMLQPPLETRRRFAQLLAADSKEKLPLDDLLTAPDEVEDLRKSKRDVHDKLQAIYRCLDRARTKDGKLTSSVDEQLRTIKLLQEYVGGRS